MILYTLLKPMCQFISQKTQFSNILFHSCGEGLSEDRIMHARMHDMQILSFCSSWKLQNLPGVQWTTFKFEKPTLRWEATLEGWLNLFQWQSICSDFKISVYFLLSCTSSTTIPAGSEWNQRINPNLFGAFIHNYLNLILHELANCNRALFRICKVFNLTHTWISADMRLLIVKSGT